MDFIHEFKRRRRTPQYWCNKSSDLRAAAGAVWYCMRKENELKVVEELKLGQGFSIGVAAFPVFPMLCGLSLELMYKAICVAKDTDFKSNHNLPNLCKSAEVSATEDDLLFLELLTESIIWHGKYPVPSEKHKHALKRLNELWDTVLTEEVREIESLKVKRYNGRLNWHTFNDLWGKACDCFHQIDKKHLRYL